MNILLTAYVAQNLGDDLFIRILCNRYRTFSFYMVCNSRFFKSFIDIENLNLIENESEIKDIDLQIMVGGSIFMQSRNKSIVEKLNLDKRQRFSTSTPLYIIGANFGPYWSELFPKLYKDFFIDVDHIIFRDMQSYELFKLHNMSYAPDLLFNYQLPPIKSYNKIAISCIKKNNRSGLRNYDENKYFDKLTEIIEYFAKKNIQTMLCAFCVEEGDYIAAKEIYSKLSTTAKYLTEIVKYEGDIKDFLNKFLSAELIIGTRFHSIILGLNAEILTVPIVYNTKTSNALKTYGFNEKLIEIQEISKYSAEFIINSQLNQMKNVSINNLRNQSAISLKLLDKILKENLL